MWPPDEWIGGTPNVDDITNEMLLPIVCSENGYLVRWVADQSHIHKHGHTVFSLCQILIINTISSS
jgi:hypothetical protein